jgi:hypothetical protein
MHRAMTILQEKSLYRVPQAGLYPHASEIQQEQVPGVKISNPPYSSK